MPPSDSQTFLRELDKKLWTAVYKHAVLGPIFLKYFSDSFVQRQPEVEAMLKDLVLKDLVLKDLAKVLPQPLPMFSRLSKMALS